MTDTTTIPVPSPTPPIKDTAAPGVIPPIAATDQSGPPVTLASIFQLSAAVKKADTRKASEKKYGKPVMDLGFCIVPSLLMWAQARLGINTVQFNIIMQLADFWWDPGPQAISSEKAAL